MSWPRGCDGADDRRTLGRAGVELDDPRPFPSKSGSFERVQDRVHGHRIKSEVDYGRGPEKTWVYGALRVRDGHQVTMAASSRNSAFYQQFLQKVEAANPVGDIYVVTDNLSSHNSLSTRTWLEDHPRIRHVFIPVGACWLNLQEGWWRIFRQGRPRRPVLRRTTRDRTRHPPRNIPAQCPSQTLDMGKTRPTHPTTTAPIHVHRLRNPALALQSDFAILPGTRLGKGAATA
ncbi:transposase [Streptomyces sp. G5(2025)]|uniref:transposase n=1 Tax=Streptomyces sp. G5(2025) TaxID=3406628 RepID=UPI003C1BD2D7